MTSTQANAGLTLEMRRVFRAPREKVFAAWTQRERLEQWMCRDVPTQNPRYLELDVRVGGRYLIEIPVAGSVYHGSGVFREAAPPAKLAFTWSWVRIPPKEGEKLQESESLVTVDLREHPDGTEMLFKHELLLDEVVYSEHEKGWEGCFRVLESCLESKEEG
jgi:uncharacterized protein YndB with AHSA1/START domain